MPKVIIIWEAPRLRGTCLGYAIFNGLRTAGKTAAFMDEPLHWRRFLPGPVPSEETRLDVLGAEINRKAAEVVLIKMQAKHLFDSQLPCPFSQHPLIEKSQHLILVRETFGALVSHRKALGRMTDISTELTEEGSGIPQLYMVYDDLRRSTTRYQVVDTDAIAKCPSRKMSALASTLDIPFSDTMISWERVTIEAPPWGRHWYAELLTSQGWRSPSPVSSEEMAAIRDLWDRLNPLMVKMRANTTS